MSNWLLESKNAISKLKSTEDDKVTAVSVGTIYTPSFKSMTIVKPTQIIKSSVFTDIVCFGGVFSVSPVLITDSFLAIENCLFKPRDPFELIVKLVVYEDESTPDIFLSMKDCIDYVCADEVTQPMSPSKLPVIAHTYLGGIIIDYLGCNKLSLSVFNEINNQAKIHGKLCVNNMLLNTVAILNIIYKDKTAKEIRSWQ